MLRLAFCNPFRTLSATATASEAAKELSPAGRTPRHKIAAACMQAGSSTHTFLAPTEAHTQRIAQLLQTTVQRGDVICMHGEVGAGKSFFCREFIRAAYCDPYLAVTSPTYLLQNIYDDLDGPAIHHFDLYRLTSSSDLQRLGWEASASSAVCLVEWADRLGSQCPHDHLDVTISIASEAEQQSVAAAQHTSLEEEDVSDEGDDSEWVDTQCRSITLQAHGSNWQERIKRLLPDLRAEF